MRSGCLHRMGEVLGIATALPRAMSVAAAACLKVETARRASCPSLRGAACMSVLTGLRVSYLSAGLWVSSFLRWRQKISQGWQLKGLMEEAVAPNTQNQAALLERVFQKDKSFRRKAGQVRLGFPASKKFWSPQFPEFPGRKKS